MHAIGQLALAVLAHNPFGDATDEFFRGFEATLEQATGNRVEILRPFAQLEKADVIRLGRDLPLGLTFSCIRLVAQGDSPISPRKLGQSPPILHCGCCNKCAERHWAFQLSGIDDPTIYANNTVSTI